MKKKRNILAQGLGEVKVGSRVLQNRKLCALLLSAMIAGILALSAASSSLTNTVAINNIGKISLSSITAKSGSPADIQAAVNSIVAAGGGTVYIPAGNFTFNPITMGTVNITFTNVPINIIGAGIGQTCLIETVNDGGNTVTGAGGTVMFARHWGGQYYNGSAVRISGISFVGNVTSETTANDGAIDIRCTQDFRIDHCSFQDFDWTAIFTDANTGGTYKLIDRGVIDHCTFDNPYRIAAQPHNATGAFYALWGYGIIVLGDLMSWDKNIVDYLGNYYPTATTNSTNCPTGSYGAPVPQPVYIEYCNFTRCRHCISGQAGAFYVARYNYFCDCFYGTTDMHGDDGNAAPLNFGTRATEVYSNIYNLTDDSYSDGQDEAWRNRGGGGVFWNNTVYLPSDPSTKMVWLTNDGEPWPYDVEQTYIWNNTCVYANGTITNGDEQVTTYRFGVSANVTQNINYFFFAPNGTNANGLIGPSSYTPYPTPAPLDTNG